MKNIIKVLLVVMALVLVVSAFVACEQDTTPDCEHKNVEFVLGKNPTCTENGLTSGFKCKDCGAWTVPQELDPAGHDYIVDVPAKGATCETDGYTAHKQCSRCDAVDGKEVIPATGHNMQKVAAKDPTCTEAGYNEHQACANGCGKTEGKEEIKALGHTAGAAATCTTAQTCTVCNTVLVEALGHNYVKGICSVCQAKDPKYVDYYLVGYINGADYGCEADYKNLGKYKFEDGKLVVKFNQNSYVFVKSANLNGENVDWFLSEEYEQGKVATLIKNKSEKMFIPGNIDIVFTLTVNANGTLTLEAEYHVHTWVAADCDTPKTCSGCGTTEGTALGHTEATVPGKAATCTENGLTEGKKCSVCGTVTVAQKEIPAEHAWGEAEANGNVACSACGVVKVSTSEGLKAAIEGGVANIKVLAGTHITNVKIPGGSNITIVGEGESTVLEGQIATTSSTEGTLTLRNLVINVNDKIVDSTGISQTGKSAIAIWGTQTVVCENVTFNMSLSDSTAITSWWDTGIGTSIVVRNCVFNANGQRPIRATGNVTVENTTFNDPYRYAVQLTAKASTATLLDKATINFKNNTIVNGASGKSFVYGIQFEGKDYGCNNLVVNGEGNTIVAGEWDTENASAMYFCECCPKVDHDTIEWNVEVDVAHEGHTPGAEATCTSAQVCTVCGDVLVEAKGHVWSDVEAKAPTCTAAGYTAHKECEECGATEGKETLDKIAHADNNGDYKCDTCSTKVLPAAGTTLTIPQANKIATLAGDAYTSQKYYITGVIIDVADTQYGNMTIADENGNMLYLYGLYSADGKTRYDAMTTKPVKGDEITVYTVLGTFSKSPQGKSAWLDELVKHTVHSWTEATCSDPKTCTICGATEGDVAEHNYVDGECTGCGLKQGVVIETATLNFTSSTRTSYSTTDAVWQANGIKYALNKGSGNNLGDYNAPARIYQNSKSTITCDGKITEIVFKCNSGKTIDGLKNALTGTNYTVTTSGYYVTVTFSEPADSLSFTATAQFRLDNIQVTYQK